MATGGSGQGTWGSSSPCRVRKRKMLGWEEGEEGERAGGERTPAPKDKIQWEGAQARRVFFKDTRNERKQEAPRGLRVRELKFKMEIYQSSD